MTDNFKVSIIVPVYNVEKYIQNCVESLLNQTYKNLEIILVDDGSPDNCPKICDDYAKKDNRIRVVHKQNGGLASARNRGLENVTGEYVVFVDSDDYVDVRYIEKLLERQQRTNADLVFCGYKLFDENGERLVEKTNDEELTVDYESEEFVSFLKRMFSPVKNNFMCCIWRALLKREIIGNLFFEVKMFQEDMVFINRYLKNCKKIAFLEDELYFYRFNPKSILHSYKKEFLEVELEIYKKFQEIFHDVESKELHKKLRYFYGNVICYGLFTNEIKYRKPDKKEKITAIKNSELYEYFTIKSGLNKGSIKMILRYFFVYFIVKFKLY